MIMPEVDTYYSPESGKNTKLVKRSDHVCESLFNLLLNVLQNHVLTHDDVCFLRSSFRVYNVIEYWKYSFKHECGTFLSSFAGIY